MTGINRNYLCPICGFNIFTEFGILPWDNDNPSDEICPSCGIQFGYTDAAGGDIEKRKKIYQQWRENWIKNGMKWRGGDDDKNKPKDWDPQQQLNILLELEK